MYTAISGVCLDLRPDTGHYCEARCRLPEEFLRQLFQLQYEAAESETPEPWKWLGKHDVKVVDGTTTAITARADAGEPYERITDYELGEMPEPLPSEASEVPNEAFEDIPF